MRDEFSQGEASDAGGLSPTKDDNEAMRKFSRKSQFIKAVYVYRDYTLEIEFNVSFEDFKTMATECQDKKPNEQPVVYVIE